MLDPSSNGRPAPGLPDDSEREPGGEPVPESADEPGAEPAAPEAKSRKDEDPDARLLYADKAVPTREELRAALAWAFEKEEVPGEMLDRFAEHAALVLAGNQRLNLTAIVDAREVAAKHYLDSWRATRLLPLAGKTVLDLGTGAGYPGIPVAIAEPQARVTLVDSIQKRADFVAETIAAMKLANVKMVRDRAEEHLARNRYDMVMLRAISSVRENVRLLRKVRHSLKDLVMLKGPSWSREVRAAEREAERLGFRLDTVWEHELPGEMGKRAILVYRAPGAQGM